MTRAWMGWILAGALACFGMVGCGDETTGDADGSTADMDAGGGDADGGGADVDGGGGDVDGGPGDDGGGATDAGDVDGGGAVDGGGGGTDAGMTSGVDCMGTTCEGATPQCCITADGTGVMATCIAADAMCMGATIECDGPEDCGGSACCVGGGGGGGGGPRCTDGASCPGRSRALCHDASDCPTTDGMAQMCCPAMFAGVSGSICAPTCALMP